LDKVTFFTTRNHYLEWTLMIITHGGGALKF
jgi:hypothetical protein